MNHSSHQRAATRQFVHVALRARRGFTLFELTLAMLLSTALLAGLWTSLILYTKSFYFFFNVPR